MSFTGYRRSGSCWISSQPAFLVERVLRAIRRRVPRRVIRPATFPFDPRTAPASRFHQNRLKRALDQRPYLAVVFNYLAAASSYLGDFRNLRSALLAIDVQAQRSETFQQAGAVLGSYPWSQAEEEAILKTMRAVMAITSSDAAAFRQISPGTKVFVVPKAVHAAPVDFAWEAGTCLFVGGSADHNRIGITWFLQNVWPLVLKQMPKATLLVAGYICESVAPDLPQVKLLGPVADLGPVYRRAQVCLAPLTVGSGLKIKVMEALGRARAVVGTREALVGIAETESKPGCVAADRPEDFASQLVRVLESQDLARRLGQEGHNYVKVRFSPQSCYQPLVDWLTRET